MLATVDGDGKDEILAAGTNNVVNGATLVLLGEDHLSGAVNPTEGCEPEADGSLARLVFPPYSDTVMRLQGLLNEPLGTRESIQAWIDRHVRYEEGERVETVPLP